MPVAMGAETSGFVGVVPCRAACATRRNQEPLIRRRHLLPRGEEKAGSGHWGQEIRDLGKAGSRTLICPLGILAFMPMATLRGEGKAGGGHWGQEIRDLGKAGSRTLVCQRHLLLHVLWVCRGDIERLLRTPDPGFQQPAGWSPQSRYFKHSCCAHAWRVACRAASLFP